MPGIPEAKLIEALCELAEELGKTPTRTEMNESGRYSSQPYYTQFGGWNDALAAAGMGPNHRNTVPEEELIEELQRVAEEVGRVPRMEDMDSIGEFSASAYHRRFGSWPAARKTAGLQEKTETTRRIGREELLVAIHELAEEIGKTPTQIEMNDLGQFSHRPYYREWESWADALRAAGFDPNHENNYNEERLLDALRNLAHELGYAPTRHQMDKQGEFWSDPYIRAFGSWTAAWEAASLKHRNERIAGRASEEALLAEVKRVAEQVGRAPTREDVHEHSQWSHQPFVRAFGSWSAALEAAGFTPYRRPGEAQRPLRYGASWRDQRERVLERDGYECQDCGISDEEHRQQDAGGLHVHHVTKLREFESVERANRTDNLVTLCRQCHSDWERSA